MDIGKEKPAIVIEPLADPFVPPPPPEPTEPREPKPAQPPAEPSRNRTAASAGGGS
jgi:hypothetical protein